MEILFAMLCAGLFINIAGTLVILHLIERIGEKIDKLR